MPRATGNQKTKVSKSMEAALWESANKLRGAVEPAEYKHVVLSLIFLKYAGDRFEQRQQELNLAIRGISADIRQGDTFHNDHHPDLKADYFMANPPFNQKDWREANQLTSDPRWSGYDTPPTSNANYGWILNILSKLSTRGVAGFLLANGALSADGIELAIRRKLIENDKVEAIIILPRNMFYSTDISVTLWILNNNKKARVETKNGEEVHYRDREGEVLFIDLRQQGEPFEKKYIQFSPEQIREIADTYHSWQRAGYEQTYRNEPEYCYSATKKGYHIEHILSHNDVNRSYFASDEEFEIYRNQLGGLLLLKDADNISSSNELYEDKLKTYSAGLVWGHTLCVGFHHINKDLDAFNSFLLQKSNEQILPIMVFDKEALEERNKLLYEIVKLIWDV